MDIVWPDNFPLPTKDGTIRVVDDNYQILYEGAFDYANRTVYFEVTKY